MINKIATFLLPLVLIFFAFSLGPHIGFLAFFGVLAFTVYTKLAGLLLFVGNLFYKTDTVRAFKWYDLCEKTGRMKGKEKLYLAFICLREGRNERAERLLNSALVFNKDKEIAFQGKVYRGLLLWKQGKLDEAIELYEELFSQAKNSVLYANLGYLYILSGDLEKATAFNAEAFEYNSDNMIIVDNMATIYMMNGELDKAYECQKKQVDADPDSPTPYVTFGDILRAKGDKEGAAKWYRKALDYKFSALATVGRADVEERIKELGIDE